jgi:hypothetical protein
VTVLRFTEWPKNWNLAFTTNLGSLPSEVGDTGLFSPLSTAFEDPSGFFPYLIFHPIKCGPLLWLRDREVEHQWWVECLIENSIPYTWFVIEIPKEEEAVHFKLVWM